MEGAQQGRALGKVTGLSPIQSDSGTWETLVAVQSQQWRFYCITLGQSATLNPEDCGCEKNQRGRMSCCLEREGTIRM